MSNKNHLAVIDEAEDVARIAEEETPALFDLSELADLSPDFQNELMANTALEHMKSILVIRMNIIGAKASHNEAQVKDLANAEMAARATLAEIKRQHPGSIRLAKDLAARAALAARQARQG